MKKDKPYASMEALRKAAAAGEPAALHILSRVGMFSKLMENKEERLAMAKRSMGMV